MFHKFYSLSLRGGGSIFKKKFWKSTPSVPLILRKFSLIFLAIKCKLLLIAILKVLFLELLITRTINVYIVNVLSFLNTRWLIVKVNLVLALKAVKKIETEESKFPQSKRIKKWNFEDKLLISMDKARKARSIQLVWK